MTPILLDAREAAALLGISLRYFRDLSLSTGFPAARSLGPRSTRWVRSELEAFATNLPPAPVVEPAHLAAAKAARKAGRPTAAAPFPSVRPHAWHGGEGGS